MTVHVSAVCVVPGWYDGTGSISGTVTDDSGNPAVRRVCLRERRAGIIVRETMSAADGTYSFPNLSTSYVFDVTVMDDDAGTQYNDITVARVTPG